MQKFWLIVFLIFFTTQEQILRPAGGENPADAALIAQAEAEIDQILEIGNEGLADEFEQAEAAAAEFDNPAFLHKVTFPREADLEEFDKWLKKPRFIFPGHPPTFNLLPRRQAGQRFRLIDIINGPQNPQLAMSLKDILDPIAHTANFAVDSLGMGIYFDELTIAISEVILSKADVFFANFEKISYSTFDRQKEKTKDILYNYFLESLEKNDRMNRLIMNFLKNRFFSALCWHFTKKIESPAIIMHPAPHDPARPQPAANTISINEYLPVRLLKKPLLCAFQEPFEMKINELVSGYKDQSPPHFITTGLNVTGSFIESSIEAITNRYLGALTQAGSASLLEVIVEFCKQKEYISTFDESIFFTIIAELCYDVWFFNKTLNKLVKDAIKSIIDSNNPTLAECLKKYMVERSKPDKQDQNSLKELNDKFYTAIHTIVFLEISPLQPKLLYDLRRGHEKFRTYINLALLVPVIYKYAPVVWNLGRQLAQNR